MNQIGLFGNHKGFAVVVVKAESKKFTVLAEEFKSEVGFTTIDESLSKMHKEYSAYQVIHNQELTLKNKINSRFKLTSQELNLQDSIFQICAMESDKNLVFNENVTGLIGEINEFDEETINHRVYALMLAVSKQPVDHSWMLHSSHRN